MNKVPNASAVAADLDYLIERYAQAENWLTDKGRKVFFLYRFPLVQLGYRQWRTTIETVKRRHARRIVFNADAETAKGLDFVEGIRRYALIATAGPGYDDTHLGRTNGVNSGRFEGKLYSALWESAIAFSPDWILITSWNEWHEGSELEDSREFGSLYRDLTATYTKNFLTKQRY